MVFVAGSSVICPALNAPPATVLRHVAGLMACAAALSTSGSSRQKPLAASAVHRWRKGLPVAGLMAVPLNTSPPAGVVSPVANCEDDCWAIAAMLPAISIIVITNARLRIRDAAVRTALARVASRVVVKAVVR